MRDIKFSQEELKLLLNLINIAVTNTKLQLGDVIVIAPLAKKIDEKVVKPEPSTQPVVEEAKPVFTEPLAPTEDVKPVN